MYHPCSNSNSGSSFNGNDLIISSSSSSYPIQPFSTIESNPSSNSKDNNELDQTNCDNNTLLSLPLPLSLFQFPYSPFEDNEIFLHHHHHHHHYDDHDDLFLHHHQSLAPPPPNETSNSGVVNMEVSITTTTGTATATANKNKNKVIPPNNKSKPTTTTTTTTTTHVHEEEQHHHHQIPITRRRSSKRDRHSKIKTARGLRDRRMRLSLDVAKRFFGLQDMLGFDKASKTVEWLLNQAKSEIKQLAREKKKNLPSYDNNNNCSTSFFGAKSASSTNSECIEGVSSLDEVALSGNHQDGEKVVVPTTKAKRSRNSNRISSRKSVFNTIGKESREKARERARERTREKKMMMRTTKAIVNNNNDNNKQCNNNEEIVTNHSGLSRLGLWNPFERTVVEESQISSLMNHSSFDVLVEPEAEAEAEAEAEERSSRAKDDNNNNNQQHHLANCCVEDDSFVIMSRWSPTMILNSLNNPGILQEHQFAEFQSMGKPWEAYNNHI